MPLANRGCGNQIANGAKLDPNEIQSIKTSINDALRSRNGMISDLEYQLLRLRKGFNDTLRTMSEKMTGFGIPHVGDLTS